MPAPGRCPTVLWSVKRGLGRFAKMGNSDSNGRLLHNTVTVVGEDHSVTAYTTTSIATLPSRLEAIKPCASDRIPEEAPLPMARCLFGWKGLHPVAAVGLGGRRNASRRGA